MKKRLLAIILCAVMIITALPVVVVPTVAEEVTPCEQCTSFEWTEEKVGDVTYKIATCKACGKKLTFKPWDPDSNTTLANGDYVYMTKDGTPVNTGGRITGVTVSIDLNGHTLSPSGAANTGNRIAYDSNISIYDSNGKGTVKDKGGAEPFYNTTKNLTIYGGTFDTGSVNLVKGLTTGKVTIYGGIFTKDFSAYVAEGYRMIGSSSGYKVISASHVCSFTWTWEGENKNVKCEYECGLDITFAPWNGVDKIADATKAVYMTGDGTPEKQHSSNYRFERSINIDLNGKTLSAYSDKRIAAYGVVGIFDSVGTGKVTCEHTEPFVHTAAGQVLNVYGGTFKTGTKSIISGAQSLNLYGGTFNKDYSKYVATNYKSFEVNTGEYKVAPAADGIVAAAVRIGSDADSSGIQFKAMFGNTDLTDANTEDANFGVLVLSKSNYDALEAKDYSSIVALGNKVINAKGKECIIDNGNGVYTMLVTINHIDSAHYADELVAVKYVNNTIVGEAAVRSVKSVAQSTLEDPNHVTEWDEILNKLAQAPNT